MIADYEKYDGMGLAELVRKREVKPEEVLETTLARAAELNPALNAIVTPLYDEARQAIVARATPILELQTRRSKLSGVASSASRTSRSR